MKHWDGNDVAVRFPGATQTPTLTTFALGRDGKATGFTPEDRGDFMRVQEWAQTTGSRTAR